MSTRAPSSGWGSSGLRDVLYYSRQVDTTMDTRAMTSDYYSGTDPVLLVSARSGLLLLQ
jgi:hypothetical protein